MFVETKGILGNSLLGPCGYPEHKEDSFRLPVETWWNEGRVTCFDACNTKCICSNKHYEIDSLKKRDEDSDERRRRASCCSPEVEAACFGLSHFKAFLATNPCVCFGSDRATRGLEWNDDDSSDSEDIEQGDEDSFTGEMVAVREFRKKEWNRRRTEAIVKRFSEEGRPVSLCPRSICSLDWKPKPRKATASDETGEQNPTSAQSDPNNSDDEDMCCLQNGYGEGEAATTCLGASCCLTKENDKEWADEQKRGWDELTEEIGVADEEGEKQLGWPPVSFLQGTANLLYGVVGAVQLGVGAAALMGYVASIALMATGGGLFGYVSGVTSTGCRNLASITMLEGKSKKPDVFFNPNSILRFGDSIDTEEDDSTPCCGGSTLGNLFFTPEEWRWMNLIQELNWLAENAIPESYWAVSWGTKDSRSRVLDERSDVFVGHAGVNRRKIRGYVRVDPELLPPEVAKNLDTSATERAGDANYFQQDLFQRTFASELFPTFRNIRPRRPTNLESEHKSKPLADAPLFRPDYSDRIQNIFRVSLTESDNDLVGPWIMSMGNSRFKRNVVLNNVDQDRIDYWQEARKAAYEVDDDKDLPEEDEDIVDRCNPLKFMQGKNEQDDFITKREWYNAAEKAQLGEFDITFRAAMEYEERLKLLAVEWAEDPSEFPRSYSSKTRLARNPPLAILNSYLKWANRNLMYDSLLQLMRREASFKLPKANERKRIDPFTGAKQTSTTKEVRAMMFRFAAVKQALKYPTGMVSAVFAGQFKPMPGQKEKEQRFLESGGHASEDSDFDEEAHATGEGILTQAQKEEYHNSSP